MGSRFVIRSGAVLGVAISAVFVQPAHATVIFDHENYRGEAWGADNAPNVGKMNDRTSSFMNYGREVTFFQDAGYLGPRFTTPYDYSSLKSVTTQLSWGNWNDRISSYRRGKW